MAWITPLFNVKEECFKASMKYISELEFIYNITQDDSLQGSISEEALYRFDANGRLPMEGSLSDVIEIPVDVCSNIFKNWLECPYTLPQSLQTIKIKLPIGYNINPGSYEECLTHNSAYSLIYMQGQELPGLGGGGVFGRATKFSMTPENMSNFAKKINYLKRLQSINTTHSIDFQNVKSMKPFINDIQKYVRGKNSSIEEIQEVILLVGLGVYSSISSPTIGMCFPKECDVADINANYAFLTKNKELVFNGVPYFSSDQFITISSMHVYTDDNRTDMPDEYPAVFVFFYVLFSFIGAFLTLGTLLDFWLEMSSKKVEDMSASFVQFCFKFVLCFSMYTNGKRLLSTESAGKDHLDCLNGIRFISMTWVVLGHSFFMILSGAVRNGGILMEVMSGSLGLEFEAVLNALPSVDTFFLMSGCLTTYIFLKELEKAGSNTTKHVITFIMYYVHRYLRITMTYILVIGFVMAVVPYIFYGPNWWQVTMESKDCQKYWWTNILYINTLIEYPEGSSNNCIGVSWYLVDDMIFHFFSPVVIYPLYYAYKMTKKHLIGMSYWCFTMACFTFGVFYIALTTRQPPSEMIPIPNLETNYTYHISFYFAPWARYQAYLIGILLGYVLHHTRGKAVQINEILNILVWQMAFLSAFAVVYGLYETHVTNYITLFEATMYNTFQRIAWNGAVAWVIFSCVKGYGGIVNEFLSWSFFAPMSRITFTTYLIHIAVQGMFAASTLSTFPNDWTVWANIWYYLPQQLISLSAGFLLALCFESPCVRVEKLIVGKILGLFIPAPPTPLPQVNKQQVDMEYNEIMKFDQNAANIEKQGMLNDQLEQEKPDKHDGNLHVNTNEHFQAQQTIAQEDLESKSNSTEKEGMTSIDVENNLNEDMPAASEHFFAKERMAEEDSQVIDEKIEAEGATSIDVEVNETGDLPSYDQANVKE